MAFGVGLMWVALAYLQDFVNTINLEFGLWWVAWAAIVVGLHVGGRFLRLRRSRD